MFYLSGTEVFLSSTLALTANENGTATDLEQLRKLYIDFGVSIGGNEVRPTDDAQQYCYDEKRIFSLISKYKDYSQLTDIETDTFETPHEARLAAMLAVSEGKKHLEKTNANLAELFDFAIHTLFYHRSHKSGGGSVSSAPGVIWCAPRINWTCDDMSEFLVHELTHNMLFIDERRHQHYVDFDDIALSENYALSAILMRPRPLDKVFHSLIVSHEVLSFRNQNGEPSAPNVHPSSAAMHAAAMETIRTIRDLISRKSLVTFRFIELLDKAEASFAAMNILRGDTAA